MSKGEGEVREVRDSDCIEPRRTLAFTLTEMGSHWRILSRGCYGLDVCVSLKLTCLESLCPMCGYKKVGPL